MSLINLLNVGKSFGEAKDRPHRYKISPQSALPRFAAARRPISLAPTIKERPVKSKMFQQRSPTETGAVSKAAPDSSGRLVQMALAQFSQSKSQRHKIVPVSGAADGSESNTIFRVVEPQPAAIVAVTASAPVPAPPAKRQERPRPEKHDDSGDNNPRTPLRAEVPPMNRGWRNWRLFRKWFKGGKASKPVQIEWALDKVTVVRNDLSDADLEVVTVQAGDVPPAKPVGWLGKREFAGEAWSRLTARLMSGVRTRVS
jgi:hypothetical protein